MATIPPMAPLFRAGSGSSETETPSGLTAFPTDPLIWRDQTDREVTAEALIVGRQLQAWQHKAIHDDRAFVRDFDPVQSVEQALTIRSKKLKELEEIDPKRPARDMEKGRWKAWLEDYGYKIVEKSGRLVTGTIAEYNVGDDIEARCRDLGLDIEPFVEVAKARKEAEIREQAIADARERGF